MVSTQDSLRSAMSATPPRAFMPAGSPHIRPVRRGLLKDVCYILKCQFDIKLWSGEGSVLPPHHFCVKNFCVI